MNEGFKHTCNIWNIVKISDTQVIYLCAVCKRKVAISDIETLGLDIIALIDLGEFPKKVYPKDEERKIDNKNLEQWR